MMRLTLPRLISAWAARSRYGAAASVGSRSSSAPYSSMDEREKGNKNIDPESQSSVAKINVAALPWSIPNGQENVNAVEDVAKRNLQHQVSSGLSNFVDEPNGEEFFL